MPINFKANDKAEYYPGNSNKPSKHSSGLHQVPENTSKYLLKHWKAHSETKVWYNAYSLCYE